MRRLGLRARVTVAATLVLAAVIGGILLAGNLLLAGVLGRDESVVLVARGEALAASIERVGGRVVVESRPSDPRLAGRAWVFVDGRPISAPLNGGVAERVATGLARATAPREVDLPAGEVRLRAVPAYDRRTREQIATAVVAVSTRPYEFTRVRTLVASLVGGLLVLLIAAWILWRSVGAALRPVERMARDAADWSANDLERRFGGGPSQDELGRLARTLDALLERIAASRRHEQRLSAEMAHELRTPLTAMRGEAELLERRVEDPEAVRAGLGRVLRLADRMAGVVDTLMQVARGEAAAPGGSESGDAERAVHAVCELVEATAEPRGVQVAVVVAPSLPAVASPTALVERALGPIVDNAVRHARSLVSVAVEQDGPDVRFVVQDDGPGVDPELGDAVLAPGIRGAGSSGSGLGLALARRIAEGCDGDVRLEPSSAGARFVLRLRALT